jgi:hypothetical protein
LKQNLKHFGVDYNIALIDHLRHFHLMNLFVQISLNTVETLETGLDAKLVSEFHISGARSLVL